MVETSPFQKFLRAGLTENGWSDAEFADRVGVVRSTVSKWVNGVTTPGTRSISLIAQALGVEERIVIENVVSKTAWVNVPPDLDPDIKNFAMDYRELPTDSQHLVKSVLFSIYHHGLSRRDPHHPNLFRYRRGQ